MESSIGELQKKIIKNDNIVDCLREAYLIASKLKLNSFKKWIFNELNGYKNQQEVPDYREIAGRIFGKDFLGRNYQINLTDYYANIFNKTRMYESIEELINLSKEETLYKRLSSEVIGVLNSVNGMQYCDCIISIEPHTLIGIIGSVKNKLLDWCLKLEDEGIVGVDLNFKEDEIKKAEKIEKSYFIEISNNNNSNITIGDIDTIKTIFTDFDSFINELKEKLNKDTLNEDNKKEALDMIDDIEKKQKDRKSQTYIKNALVGLKNFLIDVSSGVVTYLITKGI